MIDPNSKMVTVYNLRGNDLALANRLQSRATDNPKTSLSSGESSLRIATKITSEGSFVGQSQTDAVTEKSLVLQLSNGYKISKMADNVAEEITTVIQKLNGRAVQVADSVQATKLETKAFEADIASSKINLPATLGADSLASKSGLGGYTGIILGTIETNSMPKAPLVNFCISCANS